MFIVRKDGNMATVERWSQVEHILTLANRIEVYDDKGKFILHNAFTYILADIPRIYDRWANKTLKGGPAEWVKREAERMNKEPYV